MARAVFILGGKRTLMTEYVGALQDGKAFALASTAAERRIGHST